MLPVLFESRRQILVSLEAYSVWVSVLRSARNQLQSGSYSPLMERGVSQLRLFREFLSNA